MACGKPFARSARISDSDLGTRTWEHGWAPGSLTLGPPRCARLAQIHGRCVVRRLSATPSAPRSPGWRVWAFDLGRRDGATNQPKAFIAAATEVFLAAYAKE